MYPGSWRVWMQFFDSAWLRTQTLRPDAWVKIPALSVSSCVTLGKPLNLPSCCPWKQEYQWKYYFVVLWRTSWDITDHLLFGLPFPSTCCRAHWCALGGPCVIKRGTGQSWIASRCGPTNSEQPGVAVKARQVAPPWSMMDRFETVLPRTEGAVEMTLPDEGRGMKLGCR